VGAMAVEIIGNEHPVYKDKLKKYIKSLKVACKNSN
jgi:ribosomal protein L31